jgi:hypothetical protein
MQHIEAIYEDPAKAERALAMLRRDPCVAELRIVELPTTCQLPLSQTRARAGLTIGACFGVITGLLAGALVAWWVGDDVTASAAWMLGLGSTLLGALAGALTFAVEREPEELPRRGALLWLRASKGRLGRVLVRLHELGASRIEVVEDCELPELRPLQPLRH